MPCRLPGMFRVLLLDCCIHTMLVKGDGHGIRFCVSSGRWDKYDVTECSIAVGGIVPGQELLDQ